MLTIPVKVDASTEEAQQALKDLANGAKDAFKNILDLDGKEINFTVDFTSKGEKVFKQISAEQAALQSQLAKTEQQLKKNIVVQKGSITATKEEIRLLKAQRNGLQQTNPAFAEYGAKIAQAERELRKLEGTQDGSINALKAQRANFVKLRDSVKMNTPQFEALNKQIAAIDQSLGKSTKKTVTFFGALGKIATAQAAFNSVTAAFRSIGNTVDQFVRRTKDVQSFEMALKNIGMSQEEVSTTFKQAEVTARALGAPLIQVEKAYKRMLPALRAVGTNASDADKFIAGIAARTATLGLNTEQSGRLTEAFAQVLSKGKLQAEELNQQISELDGAFRTQFATALGVSTKKLNEMITAGEVTAEVFVRAFNRMQNGIEALRARIAAGNATIQQFQNIISTIDTKNLEQIGKVIEPTIKNFLAIRLAVADFIDEFSKTETFKLFANILAASSEGLLRLVQGFTKLVSILLDALDPIARLLNFIFKLETGFGGLVGVVTMYGVAVTAAFGAEKLASLVAMTKQTQALANGYTEVAGQLIKLTPAMQSAQATGAVGFFGRLKKNILNIAPALGTGTAALKKFALATVKFLISPVGAAVVGIGALLVVIKKIIDLNTNLTEGFEEVFKDYKTDVDEAAQVTEEFTGSLDDANEAVGGLIKDQILKGLPTLIAYRALMVLFNRDLKSLETSSGLAADKIKRLNSELATLNEESKGLQGKEAEENLAKRLDKQNEILITEKALARALAQRIDALKSEGKGNEIAAKAAQMKLDAVEASIPTQEENLELLKNQAKELIRNGSAAFKATVSLKGLNLVQESLSKNLDTEHLEEQTKNLQKYGRSAADASKLLVAGLKNDIDLLNKKITLEKNNMLVLDRMVANGEKLGEDERKSYEKSAKAIAKYQNDKEKAIIKTGKAIEQQFNDEIKNVQAVANVYATSASNIKSAFDGISGALSSGLQSSLGLLEAVIQTETQGLEQNSARRKELALIQLQNAVKVADIEQKLALTKLRIENTIAQNQARVAQLRLQAEAKIAAARGDTGLAGALQEAAQLQGQIRQGLQAQLRIEEGIIGIERQKTNQLLINDGLQKGLGKTAGEVAQKLGVQNTSLKQATNKVKQFATGAVKIAESFGKAATKASDLSRETEETSIGNALNAAKGLTSQLEDGSEAGNAASQAIAVLSGNLGAATGNASAMSTELKRGLDFANRLANVAGSGLPARALGGPVAAGQSYMVNDGGGREGFLSASGRFSMLPAARNMRWTAPSSGTIIPANLVDGYINANMTSKIQGASAGLASHSSGARMSSGVESGNLIKQMTNAIGAAGGNQRITNNVTIQSEKPVQDASKIMANVARMRLRNSRRM